MMSDVTACPFIHCGSSAVFRSSAMGPPWELVWRHTHYGVSSLSIPDVCHLPDTCVLVLVFSHSVVFASLPPYGL